MFGFLSLPFSFNRFQMEIRLFLFHGECVFDENENFSVLKFAFKAKLKYTLWHVYNDKSLLTFFTILSAPKIPNQ